MEGDSRRLTLYDQMSAADDDRVQPGATINGVVVAEKRAAASTVTYAQLSNRTLLDIIKDDDPNSGRSTGGHRDKRSWKSFRDRLRLKRAGASWTSSVAIPTSDIHIPVQNRRSLMSRRNSVLFDTVSSNGFSPEATHSNGGSDVPTTNDPSFDRPQISRRSSSRFSPNALLQPHPTESNDSSESIQGTADIARVRSFRPQMTRHNSTRYSPATDENYTDPRDSSREGTLRLSVALAEERALSAREAVAAQVAAEAAAAAEAETRSEEEAQEGGSEAATQPVRMSLMDLLEETDRQMGVVGSRYGMGEEEEEEREEEEHKEEEEEEEEEAAKEGGGEYNCCVCMVRHKGSAFIPCGHTFCRLCSRELWVSRGNCPLCNGFILEILDIF